MFNTIAFNTFRYGLIPIVLFCGVIITASIDAHLTNLGRKSSWSQTIVTVVESQDPRAAPNFPDPYGTVRYVADGRSYTWQGRGRDIGLVAMRPGERIALYYNPAAPNEINSLVLLGAGTGALILAAAVCFLAFYFWFFWLRGLWPRAGRGDAPPPPAQHRAQALQNKSGGASFGRRV